MRTACWFGVALAAALGFGCDKTQEPAAPPTPPPAEVPPPAAPVSAAAEPKHPTRVFFGDTHVHTGYSFDAGAFGARLGPNDAYRYATGEEVKSATGQATKLATPLDFLVVADHSENLGFFPKLLAADPKIMAHPLGKKWHDMVKQGGASAVAAAIDIIKTYSQGKFPPELVVKGDESRGPWKEIVEAAERHNAPGKFTAFIGYEWTSMPDAKNLHRVVIYRDGADKTADVLPFTALDSDDPEKLWDFLEAYEKRTGGQVLAIAHNGNLSNGQMFALQTQSGKPIDAAYAKRRTLNEPLYEVTQIKGDGEAHPYLSPSDEFASYEDWDVGNLDMSQAKQKSMLAGEYARSALKEGLSQAAKTGENPFKFGLIGSTDTHTALSTADDDNFFGKHSGVEPSATRANHPAIAGKGGKIMGWQMLASGYAAVWAHANTRESIFDAMERRETYATTGPRMTVRFFGGWQYTDADAASDLAASGYGKGVPMGGDLSAPPAGATKPSFLVAALKDPRGANLDRIQIVKGWLDAQGELHEQVFDVALSGGRKAGADGKVPPVGNTVNVDKATYENSIGAPELVVRWEDPAFDAKQRAFYYVRVLEIPTPRWTAFDKLRFAAKIPKESPMTTQERAYTSPIWYSPKP